ncbi:MAG: LacI family DNA-binding transcriptional regulator [Ferruginibacter sp.]
MKKKVSQKDIAQKVGVSTALVSYVLNNLKQGRISKAVAEKIKETARELNYRTNQIARSLKTNKTFTIGLIVADISNPFFSSLARVIEEEADKKDYTVIFGSSDESAQKSWKLINAFVDRQVDGLIIAPAENTEDNLAYLREHDIPFVLIDRYFPDLGTNRVSIDNYQAAYIAVEHLIAGGNKRPGLITYNTTLYNLTERKRGYLDALTDNNIVFEKNWSRELTTDNDKTGIENAVDDLLSSSKPVDSVLFASNILATTGLKYIHSLGIKVPGDLAIVSFDQMDASDLFYAPLTYLKQPIGEMGQAATRILLQNIEDEKKIEEIDMQAMLVIRSSTLPVNSIL